MNSESKVDEVPWVIGHRGACGYASENTLASIHKAADLGAQWVEFDVKLTADLKPVLFHDSSLGRTSDGKGKVSQFTLEELRALDAGSSYSTGYAGERIATLGEAIEVLAARGLGAMVELKASPGQENMPGALRQSIC